MGKDMHLGTCPDLEAIAALLDGRLRTAERSRVVEHLDGCERCWEVWTETARHLLDEEAEAPARIEPLRGRTAGGAWRRAAPWAAAAAAALALAVLTPVGDALRHRWGGPPGASDLARALAAAGVATAAPEDRGWSRVRGFGSGRTAGQRAFRLGVLLVDLDLALATGAGEEARALLPEVRGLVAGFERPEPLLVSYAEIEHRLEAGEPPAGLAALSRESGEAVAAAAGDDRPLFHLGSWAEAGRLAARSGGGKPLEIRTMRRLATSLHGETLPPGLRRGFEALRERLESPRPEERPEAIEADFARLVEAGGNV